MRHGPAAGAAGRRGAARPLPRHERRRLPRRGGRAARDRAPPARPDRRATSRRAGCSTSAAATGCCSTRRARRGYDAARPRALARGGASTRATRSASTSASSPLEDFAGRTATRRASTSSCSPTCIEHLDDPVDGDRRAARALLRPGGVLCVVTPDPSLADRASSPGGAGGATCPRTPCLLPRRTLRELISAARPRRSPTDVPFVRTFAAQALGRRASPSALGPVERPARRRRADALPAGRAVSLSLGDERVDPRPPHRRCSAALEPLLRDRGGARARCTSSCPPTTRVAHDPRRRRGDAGRTPPTARCWSTTRRRDETTAVALAHGLDVLAPPGQPRLRRAARRRATCAR